MNECQWKANHLPMILAGDHWTSFPSTWAIAFACVVLLGQGCDRGSHSRTRREPGARASTSAGHEGWDAPLDASTLRRRLAGSEGAARPNAQSKGAAGPDAQSEGAAGPNAQSETTPSAGPVTWLQGPLPDLAPTATAEAFPAFGSVSAPASMAEALARISKHLGARDPKSRDSARQALDALSRTDPPDADLAVFLSAHAHPALVKKSFELWSRMDRHAWRLPAMLALMGHGRDDIRHGALGALVFDYGRPWAAARVAPYLRRLLADASCPVRREAYIYLHRAHVVLGLQNLGLAVAALQDPCPAVRVQGLDSLPPALTDLTPAQAARVASLARSSAFPIERCAAYGALARLRHPEAEAVLAQGLATAAGTTLLVGFRSKGVGSLSLSLTASLPECAALALDLLAAEKRKRTALERVFSWRAALARKKLVARPPERPCLSEADCRRDSEVCLHLGCTPFALAREAFFQHRKAERCQAGASHGPWHNDQPDYTIREGFGLDPLGPFRIQSHLTRAEPEAFAARTKAQDAQPCQGTHQRKRP